MAFVVTENCIRCKYTDCVEVCPVDCFHEGPDFLVINPEECIDCALCEPECPANAIFAEDDLPEEMNDFIEINARLSEKWPIISTHIEGRQEEAAKWDGVPNKRQYLEEDQSE